MPYSFPNQSSYFLPNYFNQPPPQPQQPTPPIPPVTPQAPTIRSGNPVASSIGTVGMGGFGGIIPDLSLGNPTMIAQGQRALAGATFSVPSGGYISNDQAGNANSYYNKFGGYDRGLTADIQRYYSYLGTLPTTTAPLLGSLFAGFGGFGGIGPQPKPPPGPSYNSLLAPFGMTYQGPWNINEDPRFRSTPVSGPGYG